LGRFVGGVTCGPRKEVEAAAFDHFDDLRPRFVGFTLLFGGIAVRESAAGA